MDTNKSTEMSIAVGNIQKDLSVEGFKERLKAEGLVDVIVEDFSGVGLSKKADRILTVKYTLDKDEPYATSEFITQKLKELLDGYVRELLVGNTVTPKVRVSPPKLHIDVVAYLYTFFMHGLVERK